MSGKLYIVPTPIGNLKDITLRALEVLKEVDLIGCEDTRQSLKLLNHFDIKKSLISYHKHNENGRSDDIIKALIEGKRIAIISDAGTPGVSDPGEVIIKKCIEENIEIEVLPGATAFTTALVYSGLNTDKFTFIGFLPKDNKSRRETCRGLINREETIILYEAPHRMVATLEFLLDTFGNRKVAICRELTKLYEEIVRNNLEGCIKHFNENSPRGEFVIVMEGKNPEEILAEKRSQWEHMTIEDHIKFYIENGISKKESIKMVAKERSMTKSEIYKHSIDM